MSEMKVFVLTQGSYSDYRIVAVFSTKEKAKEFTDEFKQTYDDYNELEEYTIDPPFVDLKKRGYFVWNVLMLRDGSVERINRTDNDAYDVIQAGSHTIWQRTKAQAYKGKGIPDVLHSLVWAKTEKQAIKIVNDKRAQMIANGEWL